jgi:hypothetical protein
MPASHLLARRAIRPATLTDLVRLGAKPLEPQLVLAQPDTHRTGLRSLPFLQDIDRKKNATHLEEGGASP